MNSSSQLSTEVDLKTATAILIASIQNSPAGIIVAESESGRIRFINQAAIEIAGGNHVNVVDSTVAEYVSQLDLRQPDGTPFPQDQLPLSRAFSKGEAANNVELIVRHKNGDEIWVLANASPVRNESGKIVAGIVVFHDISERKKAEHSLRESEDRFRMLSEATFEGIVITEQGKTVDCSDRFCSMLCYSRSELIGDDVFKYVTPDDIEMTRSIILSGSEQPYEARVTRKDGSVIVLQARGRTLQRGDKLLRIAAVRDVTEKRISERELRESEERFKTLAAATFEGIGITENGVVIDVNEKMAEILGYSQSELVGIKVSELVAPEDRDLVRNKIMTDFESPYEHRSVRKDGTTILVEARGKIVQVAGKTLRLTAIRDITDRKRAELALAESELRYRTLFNNSPDGVLLLSGDTFIECNQQMADMFGCTIQEVIGRKPFEFSPQFQADGIASETAAKYRIESALAGNTLTFEWVHTRKSGEIFDAEVRLKHVDLQDGRCLLAFVRDISERKRAEHERSELANQVSKSRQRLAMMSKQLLDSQENERRKIARELHDEIGQHLTAMKINIQHLSSESKSHLNDEKLSARVTEQITLIDSVITEVRNLALDLRPSILDDLGLVPAIRWYVDRQTRIGNLQGIVEADPQNLELASPVSTTCFRIVQEAVTNVLRHANAKEIRVNIELRGQSLRVSIEDNGKGFNAKEAMQRSVAGKSFGLLGMEERLELIGGILEIRSQVGVGTKIIAVMPVNSEEIS